MDTVPLVIYAGALGIAACADGFNSCAALASGRARRSRAHGVSEFNVLARIELLVLCPINKFDRNTPAAMELHLIADNYATHKHRLAQPDPAPSLLAEYRRQARIAEEQPALLFHADFVHVVGFVPIPMDCIARGTWMFRCVCLFQEI
jgi:hypothetical protein